MKINNIAAVVAAIAVSMTAAQEQHVERDVLSDIRSIGASIVSQASVAIAGTTTSRSSAATPTTSSPLNNANTNGSSRASNNASFSTNLTGGATSNMNSNVAPISILALLAAAGVSYL